MVHQILRNNFSIEKICRFETLRFLMAFNGQDYKNKRVTWIFLQLEFINFLDEAFNVSHIKQFSNKFCRFKGLEFINMFSCTDKDNRRFCRCDSRKSSSSLSVRIQFCNNNRSNIDLIRIFSAKIRPFRNKFHQPYYLIFEGPSLALTSLTN